MRKVGWVVGLLLCASCQGSAEAKRREPPTRSQAFADCQTRVPHTTECYRAGPDCFYQVRNCSNLIKAAEAAFKTGRWHPSQGPWGQLRRQACRQSVRSFLRRPMQLPEQHRQGCRVQGIRPS